MTAAVYALGLILVIAGAASIWMGAPIVHLEEGWSEVIAGSVGGSAGFVILALGVCLSRLERIVSVLRGLDAPTTAEVVVPPALAAAEPPALEGVAAPAFGGAAAGFAGGAVAHDFREREAEPEPEPKPDVSRPVVDIAPAEPEPVVAASPSIDIELPLEPPEAEPLPETVEPAAEVHHEEPLPPAPAILPEEEPSHGHEAPPVASPMAEPAPALEEGQRRRPKFLSGFLARAASLSGRGQAEPVPAIPPRDLTLDPPLLPLHEVQPVQAPGRTPIDLSSGWNDWAEDERQATQSHEASAQHEGHGHAEADRGGEGEMRPTFDEHPGEPMHEVHDGPPAPHPLRPVPEPAYYEPESAHFEPAPADIEPEPQPARPQPEPQNHEPEPEPAVVGRYQAGSASYVMYSDGSIEVETDTGGVHRFASMQDLKAFIEQQETARV